MGTWGPHASSRRRSHNGDCSTDPHDWPLGKLGWYRVLEEMESYVLRIVLSLTTIRQEEELRGCTVANYFLLGICNLCFGSFCVERAESRAQYLMCTNSILVQAMAGNSTLIFYNSEEAEEGRKSYLEKRKPDFSKFKRLPWVRFNALLGRSHSRQWMPFVDETAVDELTSVVWILSSNELPPCSDKLSTNTSSKYKQRLLSVILIREVLLHSPCCRELGKVVHLPKFDHHQ